MVLLKSALAPLGSQPADFELLGIDDRRHTLDEFRSAKVLVIIFMCNHCPYIQAILGRLVALQQKYQTRGVQFIGINANINPDYPEDSFEMMKQYARKRHMNFPYLCDETQAVAREYQAKCTPDIFVYNDERKLAYHGRVDDAWDDESKVQRPELDEAISALLRGERPSNTQEPSMGCSIKWRE